MEIAILMVHTLEIQTLPFLLNPCFPILIIFSVCYLILHCLEESGLDLMEDLLTVLAILTVIHFTTDTPANLTLYRPNEQGFGAFEDQLYKCCLPTNCSNPTTNIITAYIFSKLSHCTST